MKAFFWKAGQAKTATWTGDFKLNSTEEINRLNFKNIEVVNSTGLMNIESKAAN